MPTSCWRRFSERLQFLNDVGLEYLTLDRLASTLSGGEAQRIQLATSLGSRLVGTLYVLDEPSIGLHSRDTHRLIKILHDLRDLGNTILVVEHDPDVMRASDRILDLGPGAGESGGKVIAAGTYDEILKAPSFADRTLSLRRTAHSASAGAAQAGHAADQDLRRAGPQSQEYRFRHSAGNAGRDHRRVRLGQIDAAARCALSGACRPPRSRPTAEPTAIVADLARTGRRRSHRRRHTGGPVADRAHAALESGDLHQGLRRDPRTVCFPARSQEARLHAPGIFPSISPEAAAKPARATARSPWKCSFWPTSN